MTFRDQLISDDLIWGPFYTAPSIAHLEATARIDCDCVCLDAEHGVYDRRDIDLNILALRSVGIPAIVRIPDNRGQMIGAALDAGADAILCPHIRSAESARSLANAARYATGRGFSGAVRSAGYGTQLMADQIERADRDIAVIAQIEDADALDHVEAICATPELDCIFIGRSDLTVSMGKTDRNDPDVIKEVIRIAKTAKDAGKSVGTFVTDPAQIPQWRAHGIHFFLMGSDIAFLISGGNSLAERIRQRA